MYGKSTARASTWVRSTAYRADCARWDYWRWVIYGVGHTLKWAGPSVLLAYIIAGIFVFFIMRSMEMLFLEPVTGSFASFGYKYLSPFWDVSLRGATGLCGWPLVSQRSLPFAYAEYWFPDVPQWIFAIIAVVLVALANLAAVRLYGELEFWFAMIKVTTIVVMILIGLGLIFFGPW